MKKKATALLLSVLVILTMIPTAHAAELPFTDVSADTWYYRYVRTAYESGLVKGATEYSPNEELTYAEAVTMAVRIYQRLHENSITVTNGSPWYQPYVDYAKDYGIISKDYNWNAKATRADYMEIFAGALRDKDLKVINSIADGSIPDVPMTHPQANAIYKLYRAGIVSGSDAEHNCCPESGIVRSEIAAILTRIIDKNERVKFSLDSTEKRGEYAALSDVGTYDKSIITDALLDAPTSLPEVTQAEFPSQWKGAGISARKSSVEEYRPYSESDIRFLNENGFNFTRLFLSFETLRYPDLSKDPQMVNLDELRELDQLLAWCMEYGVHLQIAMNCYLNTDGSDKQQGKPPDTEAEWALAKDYWAMLARRYAGIPSQYLTFDLNNEGQPYKGDNGSFTVAKKGVTSIINAVRAEDPGRVLLYSTPDSRNLQWVEYLASLNVGVGCHVYAPVCVAMVGIREISSNSQAKMIWPMPHFPISKASIGQATISFTGEVDDSTLSFFVEKSGKDAVVTISGDGKKVKTIELNGTPDKLGDCYYNNYFTAQIPAGIEKIQVKVERSSVRFATFVLERNGVKTVMVPSGAYGPEDRADPPSIIVKGDGTYANSLNTWCDEDWIYENHVKPSLEIAQKYGVGFMINEFGLAAGGVNWPIETVVAFHETYLKMLEKYDLSWCYCEIANVFPKHLIILSGKSQWAGATTQTVTYTFDDGSSETIRICKELVDIFRKYTLK